MVQVSAPGKLFLTGEWAILEMRSPGIVAAVNKRVHAKITESKEIRVKIHDFSIDVSAKFENGKIIWNNVSDEQKEKLIFIKGAIETTMQYLGRYKTFSIETWGDLSQIKIGKETKKVGFGSSAASVVAVVAALLAFHGQKINNREAKDIVYKLSAIAHYFAQGKVGSSFDVAASTYGGIFVYKRFDADWLVNQIKSKSVKAVLEENWPGFYLEELEIPDDFILLISWTKESASTPAMVKQMEEYKKQNQDEYSELINEVGDMAKKAIDAWKKDDREKLLRAIMKNEEVLRKLGKKSKVNIETEDLRKLSELAEQAGGAGKLSGAGGGDCGIGVAYSKSIAEKIKKAWSKEGLYIVDATVDRFGIKEE